MCAHIFAYCVHAKSAGISIKTSHEHLLLHCPAVPMKVAKFQVAKNKRIDRRFIYISDSLLSPTLPASDFHPPHRRGKCLACISLLFADSSARVLALQACENHCKFSIYFKTTASCCKKIYKSQNKTGHSEASAARTGVLCSCTFLKLANILKSDSFPKLQDILRI